MNNTKVNNYQVAKENEEHNHTIDSIVKGKGLKPLSSKE